MKTQYTILIILLLPVFCFGQSKQDYNWILGYDYSKPLEGIEGGLIDFKDGSRTISTKDIGIVALPRNNASISNEEGEFLFVTNGCQVYDSTFQLMTNGDSLNNNEWYEDFCYDGANGYQNTMILPDPANDEGYYILHQPLAVLENPFNVQTTELFYSYVDTDLGSTGEVTIKNEVYFRDTIGSGLFSACQHANGSDWWFIKNEFQSNNKYVFLISEDGISLEHTIAIGGTSTSQSSAAGQGKFSSDGAIYATSTYQSGVNIYDFDRSTGILSNNQNIFIEETSIQVMGLEISPSGQFLYTNYVDRLFQLDLWADDIEESITLIDTFDGFTDPFPVIFGPQQLGPDCKIYMAGGSTVPYMHVINNPDERGTACNFDQHGINLPFRNDILSIPNFPHFRIDETDICDPTITHLFGIPVVTEELVISPNPARDFIRLSGDHSDASFVILSQSGQIMMQGKLDDQRSIEISSLPIGTYIIKLLLKDKVSLGKFVKV